MKSVLFFFAILFSVPSFSQFENLDPNLGVIGHRGARAIYPENSLEAFDYAKDHADLLELDVHLTSDGWLAVTHDPKIKSRCQNEDASAGRVILELPYENVAAFDCGSTRDSNGFPKNLVPGSKIPNLNEVIELVQKPDGSSPLVIEVKYEENKKYYPTREAVVNALFELLKKYHVKSGLILQSFDTEILKMLVARKSTSGISYKVSYLYLGDKIGPLPVPRYKKAFERIKEIRPDYFSPHHLLMTIFLFKKSFRKYIEGNREKLGYGIIPWTANGPKNWSRVMKRPIAQIITDDPQGLRDFLKSPNEWLAEEPSANDELVEYLEMAKGMY